MLLWRNACERELRERLGSDLRLIWTANRRVMISFKRKGATPILRLHENFALADNRLQADLASYLARDCRKVPKSVKEFINSLPPHDIKSRAGENLTHRGKQFNLRTIYQKLNRAYFKKRLKGKIVWGRKIFSRTKQNIVLGSYYPADETIRIHPVLDTEIVPRFYLEAVVYHEMVHEQLDKVENRRGEEALLHTKRFKELERRFRFHILANAWEKRHLEKLLSYRPKTG